MVFLVSFFIAILLILTFSSQKKKYHFSPLTSEEHFTHSLLFLHDSTSMCSLQHGGLSDVSRYSKRLSNGPCQVSAFQKVSVVLIFLLHLFVSVEKQTKNHWKISETLKLLHLTSSVQLIDFLFLVCESARSDELWIAYKTNCLDKVVSSTCGGIQQKKPSGLTSPNDFCRLSSELSSSEASILATTIASLMLNRNSVASHRKNCSLIYHWDPSDAAHLVDCILYHCDDLTRPLGGTTSFNLIH